MSPGRLLIAARARSPCWLVVLAIVLICTTRHAASEPHPWAENVCNKSVPVKRDIVIEQPVQYEIKVQTMCGILPCTKTRLETRQDQTIKTIVVHERQVACCDGYAETPARQCAPICLDPCNNGKCVAPNVCKCSPEPTESAPGYVGPTCKRFTCLASQRWGAKCDRECPTQCSQNSYCSADSGRCLCYPGWHGPECSLECEPDSDADDCQDNNKLPPIMEPEANLLSGSLVTSLSQDERAQALVRSSDGLDDGIKIVREPDSQAWASFASSYLVGLLGLMSLIFLVAFLIVKRRYELVRNELYYASAASALSGQGRPGPGSEYSAGSSFYSTSGRPPSLASGADGNLEKNLSFAAATRNILSGVVVGKQQVRESEGNNKLLLFTPRVESHLIRSQQQAEQNIYSELEVAATDKASSRFANRSRAQTPERQAPKVSDDHIYAVPKSPVGHMSRISQSSGEKLHDTSVEMGDLDDSNIYEELKPRSERVKRQL